LPICSLLPERDALARVGGDEFYVILDRDQGERGVTLAGQGMLDALAAPFTLDGQAIYVNATIGVALYPEDGTTASELLSRADATDRQAKADGRGSLRFFSPEIMQRAKERRRSEEHTSELQPR